MHKINLIISPSARQDLKNIQIYSLQKWGKTTTQNYIDNLRKNFKHLFNNPLLGTERPELGNGLRSLMISSHIIFYRYQAHQIEIARILHKRQDPSLYFKIEV